MAGLSGAKTAFAPFAWQWQLPNDDDRKSENSGDLERLVLLSSQGGHEPVVYGYVGGIDVGAGQAA